MQDSTLLYSILIIMIAGIFANFFLHITTKIDHRNLLKKLKLPIKGERKFFLIDYENFQWNGMNTYEKCIIDTKSIIVYFIGNQKKIKFCKSIPNFQDRAYYYRNVINEKNSVDVVIGTFLGYLATSFEKNVKIYIVSKDRDYKSVVTYWQNHGLNVELLSAKELENDCPYIKILYDSLKPVSVLTQKIDAGKI